MRTGSWKRRLGVPGAVVSIAILAAACGGGDDETTTTAAATTAAGAESATESATTAAEAEGASGGTLVFGTSSDPVVLDGALVSDGESIRVIDQIAEGLVGLKPGTTELEPALATEWEAAPDGLTWTFKLREGVKFHDGTDFNAEAVCFNFDRWYNFKGALQNPSASYYWQTVFGGFAKSEGDAPKESLYKSCTATDPTTVDLALTKPSSSFLGALALSAFAIHSPDALKQYGADEGTVDADEVFRPTGTYGVEHPTGTGPFKFDSWERGEKLTIVRFDEYWGDKAKLDSVVFRPIADNAARLQALQAGEIQGYDLVEPQDIETIKGDDQLQVLDRPAFNVAYVGFNQKKPPLDKLEVRQAIAHALNRQEVVDTFYAGRGQVAKQFMPPEVVGYADDVTEYEYDPEKSKQLLQQAGLKLPVAIQFAYPTDVSRPYMPDPKRNFEAFRASLEKAGFKVTPKSAPWSPDYLGNVDQGNYQMYLLGWTGDYGDPDNFIGTFFQIPQKAWGFDNPEIFKALNDAETETDEEARKGLYEEANRKIMEFLPGVPYAHSQPALAFRADVQGYTPSPVSLEPFSLVSMNTEG